MTLTTPPNTPREVHPYFFCHEEPHSVIALPDDALTAHSFHCADRVQEYLKRQSFSIASQALTPETLIRATGNQSLIGFTHTHAHIYNTLGIRELRLPLPFHARGQVQAVLSAMEKMRTECLTHHRPHTPTPGSSSIPQRRPRAIVSSLPFNK